VTRFVVTELRVADIDRSLDFYKRVLNVPFADITRHADDEVPHAHASWGSWRDGEQFVRLNIYPRGERAPTRAVIGFVVRDLQAVHRRLIDAGTVCIQGPSDKPWGITAAYLDPDGNEIGLTQLRPRAQ
jgi:predicted enzyme related to lactoylglutathione lyase